MISHNLDSCLQNIFITARSSRHEFITVEHLLLALLEENSAQNILQNLPVDMDQLKNDLERFIEDSVPVTPKSQESNPEPTLGFQRVIQRSILFVQKHYDNKTKVLGEHVLASIFSEKDSHAVYFLHTQHITRADVLNLILNEHPTNAPDTDANEPFIEEDVTDSKQKNSRNKILLHFTTNLNQLAKANKLTPLIGRDEELERLIHILCRQRKNNPLLIGESGVGKTALIEGLAQAIVNKKVPEHLANAKIFTFNSLTLLSKQNIRGEFESRMQALFKALKQTKDAILFIDDFNAVFGGRKSAFYGLDIANILRPALRNGDFRCIGTTTFKDFNQISENEAPLARLFQKLEITEPSINQTIQILNGLKPGFEKHHEVTYSDNAILAAAELSSRYITDAFLPDKAIDVIDEAGATNRLLSADNKKETITRTEIAETVAKLARIPVQNVNENEKNKLKNLERDLKTVIFGQDQAINLLSTCIKTARAGLGHENKPIGSFLFAGPTGVGKTELARQLAFALGIDFIRFDMSEYAEQYTVSRLIGSAPGYIGYENGGLLTDAVIQKPHAVLLLDEIEKAHSDIFNLLLQVMDSGSLTDSRGKAADFRHAIIIMTTNAGAESLQKTAIGFTQQKDSSDAMVDINRIFSPEFRNRLDAIIHFNALTQNDVLRVIDKFLMQLENQLAQKHVDVTFSESLRNMLLQKGFDSKMGARPMERLIQETIRKLLADELLFGRLVNGGNITVDCDEQNETRLTINET